MAPGEIMALRGAAYAIAWPLVYDRHTRALERRKGHRQCATSVDRLATDCLDGFQDDVEAVVDDLFAHANRPIVNLEGWLVSRLTAATIDGYRRRRGSAGAQQRPRVPAWLALRLESDPWLVTLAMHILDWVGVAATAGYDTWPTAEWAVLRAAVTGNCDHGEELVAREIEMVLTAMRDGRPDWYQRYVERPLGRKQSPVEPGPVSPASGEPRPALLTVTRDERDDARLRLLAGVALDLIERRLDAGDDPRVVVPEVVGELFLGRAVIADELDLTPCDPGSDRADSLSAALVDPIRARRIVGDVLAILAQPVQAAQKAQVPPYDDVAEH
jgi:hypothetical protein